MINEISLVLLTGCCWCLIGVTYSRAVDHGLHPALMPCVTGLLLALIASFNVDWSRISATQSVVPVSMIISGVSMTASMIALQTAMRCGGHGLPWTVAQAGLVWPFIVAVWFHGERPSFASWIGLVCIIASLLILRRALPGQKEEEDFLASDTNWFGWALLAWALIGIQQSAFQWPSHANETADPASIRLPLLFITSGLASAVVLLRARLRQTTKAGHQSSLQPTAGRAFVGLALLAVAANACAQSAILRASDALARLGAAGIAFPIAIGTCIALFIGFTSWRRCERLPLHTILGLCSILVGIVLLGL